MKKRLFLAMVAAMIGATSLLAADVLINETNFPDAAFRNFLKWQAYGKDGKLTDDEIASVTTIIIQDGGIASLKGIEHFTSLELLDVTFNELTSLDLSQNKKLQTLRCSYNKLTSLDLSQNKKLKDIKIMRNQINSENMLTLMNSLPLGPGELDATDKVDDSLIEEMGYTEGNIFNEEHVKAAYGRRWTPYYYKDDYTSRQPYDRLIPVNERTFPDKNFRQIVIDGLGNLLTEEILSKSYRFRINQRLIYDLTGIEYFTEMEELSCYSNYLTSLDLSKNTKLKYLNCDGNNFTSLDLSKNTKLKELSCAYTDLTSLDLSKNTDLEVLDCSHMYNLTDLDVSKNTALTTLVCPENDFTSLDVSMNTKLETLDCSDNKITSLDLSKNVKLKTLTCQNNEITDLDLSKNILLEELDCNYNQLETLYFPNNALLKVVDCRYNKIRSLDLSNATDLQYLYCYNNELVLLDVSNCTSLVELRCGENWLPSIYLSNNSKLQTIHCYENRIKSAKMTQLIESLPNLTGRINVISDENENNEFTDEHIQAAYAKGWTPCYYTTGIGWQAFPRNSTPTTIAAPEAEASATDTDAPSYNVRGQRVGNDYKGVGIVNGKKVIR